MRAWRVLLPVVLVVALACVRCSVPRIAAPVEDGTSRGGHALTVADAPRTIDELKRRIAAVLAEEGAPGAAIALVGRDGPIWVGGIGVRSLESEAPMEADTMFRVGSVSKSIVALAVMRLADQGKLDVDAPLRELLPGLVDNPWEAVAPVTLAQCLEHTAGLGDFRFNEVYTDDETIPVADALAINPRSRVVRWRPGTRHGYSNVGYTIAARAVEVASGVRFDTYVREEILAPMGITDAPFWRTADARERLAVGYQNGRAQQYFALAHRPAAALLISAEDLGKLVHFWIRRGEGYPPIVSEAGLARIERNGTLAYPQIDTEYGFANYVDVAHPTLGHGHDGGMPGFQASYRYFSDLGVGYAMLVNSNYTFRGYYRVRALLYAYLTRDLRAAVEGTRVAASPARRVDTPSAEFYALASSRYDVFGFIEQATIGWRIAEREDSEEGGLDARALAGETFRLEPTADGAYRFPEDSGSSVQFFTDDGTPVMILGFSYAEGVAYWFAQLRYWALSFAVLLLTIAPLWSAAHLAWRVLRGRHALPRSLVLPPAIAGLSFFAAPHLMFGAFEAGVIGRVHPLTVGLCVSTIVFALSSTMTLAAAVRWSLHPERPRARSLVLPLVFGVAFFALTVWGGVHGLIGFRTWSY